MNKPFNSHALALLFFLVFIQTQLLSQIPDTTLARQYFEEANALEDERQTSSAIELFQKAGNIFANHEMWEDWLRAQGRLSYNYGIAGTLDTALLILDNALLVAEKKVDKNSSLIANVIMDRANIIYHLGRYQEAIDIIQDLVPTILKNEGEKSQLVRGAYYLLGQFYKRIENFDKALEYDLKALEITLFIFGENNQKTAASYEQIGNTYIFMANYEQALPYHLNSLNIRKKLFEGEDHPRLKGNYTNLGICYTMTDQRDKAEGYFLKANDIVKKMYGENHPAMASALWNLGHFYITGEDFKKALDCYQQELSIRKAINYNSVNLAHNYARIAESYFNLGHPDTSLIYYQKALALVSEGISASNIYQNPEPNHIFLKSHGLRYFHGKLGALYKLVSSHPENTKAYESALQLGNLSLELWNELSRELGTQQISKQYNSRYARESIQYTSLIAHSFYHQTGNKFYQEQAWLLAEQGKSLLLQEAWQTANAQNFAGLPDEIMKHEKQLRQELSDYESQLLTAIKKNDSLAIAQLRNDLIFNKKQEYERLISGIEQNYPQYYDLKYSSKTISLNDVQNLLSDQQLFVEYLVHEESGELLIFVVEKNKDLQIYRRQLPKNISQNTAEFNKILKSYVLNRKDKKNRFIALSHQFYQLLIQPLEAHLEGKEKMVVVGEGFTNYIPFEALLSEKTDKDFTEQDFLIRQVEISYHYSATLFARSHQNQKNYKQDLLAFAPVFDDNTLTAGTTRSPEIPTDTIFRSIDSDGKFTPLTYTEQEVKNIVQLFKNQNLEKIQLLLRQDASEQQLKTALKNDYRFVHLASHSFSNLKQPELSGIACTTIQQNSTENGILFSGEIYNMAINSDLVVLSSCESGLGKIVAGEGMLGLNRGFAYAGVPNVVFSLWKVYDKVTSDMMYIFYKEILKGASYSAALRTAKLQLLEDERTASPHYWSAFLLIGK